MTDWEEMSDVRAEMVPDQAVQRDHALGRSTATIAGLTLVSRVSGFARIVVVTAVLGTTALGDVYETANLVPNILFELFAAGSVQAVMVPALVAADERDGSGNRLANAVLGWLLATLGVLMAFALVVAPLAMRAPDRGRARRRRSAPTSGSSAPASSPSSSCSCCSTPPGWWRPRCSRPAAASPRPRWRRS